MAGKPWTPKELEYLKENWPYHPAHIIAQNLDRSEFAVNIKASRLGVKTQVIYHTRDDDLWTDEEEKTLRNLYPTEPTRFVAKTLGRSMGAVGTYANKIGLIKTEKHRRYRVNRWAFSPLTPESAYVLGFILADGCIQGNAVTMASTDLSIIEKIQKVLRSNHPILETWSNKSSKFAYRIALYDKQIISDLSSLGITPRKSLTATLPDIPDNLFFHFLRGYFDGDGSAYLHRNSLTVSFVSASERLLPQIIKKIAILSELSKYNLYNGKHAWTLSFHGAVALKLADLMYSDCGNLYLQRKKSVIDIYGASRENIPLFRNHKWTLDEINYLKSVYKTLTCDEIAVELQRSPIAVKDKLYRLLR